MEVRAGAVSAFPGGCELRWISSSTRTIITFWPQRAIADVAYGEAEPESEKPAKDPERVERGKLDGGKGGKLPAEKLTPERRAEIARAAASPR